MRSAAEEQCYVEPLRIKARNDITRVRHLRVEFVRIGKAVHQQANWLHALCTSVNRKKNSVSTYSLGPIRWIRIEDLSSQIAAILAEVLVPSLQAECAGRASPWFAASARELPRVDFGGLADRGPPAAVIARVGQAPDHKGLRYLGRNESRVCVASSGPPVSLVLFGCPNGTD